MRDVVPSPVPEALVRGVVTTGISGPASKRAVAAMSGASTATAAPGRRPMRARRARQGSRSPGIALGRRAAPLATRRNERTRQVRPWSPGPALRAGPRLAAQRSPSRWHPARCCPAGVYRQSRHAYRRHYPHRTHVSRSVLRPARTARQLYYLSASTPPEPITGMQPSPAGLPTAP
jgi:hypothetical protein